MNAPDTTKPYTRCAGLHKVDQLAGQIDYSNSKPQPQTQGPPPQNPNYFDATALAPRPKTPRRFTCLRCGCDVLRLERERFYDLICLNCWHGRPTPTVNTSSVLA